MRIGLHLQAQLFGARITTPALTVAEEELLQRRVTVLFGIEIEAFSFGIGQECDIGEPQAAVVGGVFAERELAIDLHVINHHEVAVLVNFTIGFFLELLSVLGGPPILEIAVAIELAALVVKGVGQFVATTPPMWP